MIRYLLRTGMVAALLSPGFINSGYAGILPVAVDNNTGGGLSYIGGISTAGSTMAAVNLGHTGSDVTANGIPFVNFPGVSPTGSGWSVSGSAVDDGLGNVGIDDLFFSEVWGLNPVSLTFSGLDPSRLYIVQILHGEPRNCCQGTHSNNTFSTNVDAAVLVPVFTIGNSINGDSPPAANDVAIITTGISGATSFVYNAFAGVGRGGSIAGFQVRDLGPANSVTTTTDSSPGSLRGAIFLAPSGGSLSFDPSLAGAIINLTSGALVIDKDLSLDASGLPGGLTIDAGGNSRVISVASGASVVLDSLNITGGRTPDVTGFEASAASGGGIQNVGNLILHRVAIYGNATGKGGPPDTSGFDGYGGDGGDGGGVFNSGELAISNSTISGNSTGDGGGSTSPNTSGGDAGAGAGIFNRGTLSLMHTTISGNVAGALGDGDIDPGRSQGGGIYQLVGTSQIENSIVAGNSVPPGGDGENLYTRGGSIAESGANFLSGDPMLAPLGQYGGATLAMRPLVGSPVIDAAIDDGVTVTDQRGFPRPIGSSSDIGAVEIYVLDASPYSGETGIGLTPAFGWNAFPGASYEVFIDSGSGLESIGVTGGTSLRTSDVLDINTIYAFRIDVTPAGENTRSGDVGTFITRGAALVTTEIDEDDSGLGSGAGNSLRELIRYSDLNGNIIRFSPALDGSQIVLTGGELLIEDQWLEIDGSTLTRGITIDAGGASRVFNTNGTVILRTLSISGGNGVEGGAIINRDLLTLDRVTVSGSSAADGGGVFSSGTQLDLNQCTIVGNTATASGGGIYLAAGVGIRLSHCTVADNSAIHGGGVCLTGGSILQLENSIIAANSAATSPDAAAAAGVALDGGNLIGNTEGISASSVGLISGVEAKLGVLGDYGGPIPTIPLLANCPAIDAGVNLSTTPATDQRGNPRVLNGGLDIGAFEAAVSNLSPAGGRLHARISPSPPADEPGAFEISLDPSFSPSGKAQSQVIAGSGVQGNVDASAGVAQFDFPSDVATDASGSLYIADAANHAIRKVTPSGDVTTIAGTGSFGFADGGGQSAQFAFPSGIALGPAGEIYVSDTLNHCIRKLTPPLGAVLEWTVSTLAGAARSPGFRDSIGAAALFFNPNGLAVDAAGAVYVADTQNHRVRKISPSGMVTTLAGSATPGLIDAIGSHARFSSPMGVALDPAGFVYVADRGNHSIRRIAASGEVITVAGSPSPDLVDGAGADARFHGPTSIAVSAGRLLVADQGNHVLRMITETAPSSGSWEVFTFSGNGYGQPFASPGGIAISPNGGAYIADAENHQIRFIGRPVITIDAILAPSGELVADLDALGEGVIPGKFYFFRWISESGVPDSAVQVLPLPQFAADDFADPDWDGIINLFEDAYGLDRHRSSQDGLPVLEFGDSDLLLTYNRAAAAGGLSLRAEWSFDLSNWTPAGISEQLISTGGAIDVIRATIPVRPGPRLFVRINVRRTTP